MDSLQASKHRVKKIRDLLGCGILEARKYELYLRENQIELDIDSLRHLKWGNPKSELVTSVRKTHCYQCDAEVYELSPRSRCVTCEYNRAEFNAKENDSLRQESSDNCWRDSVREGGIK